MKWPLFTQTARYDVYILFDCSSHQQILCCVADINGAAVYLHRLTSDIGGPEGVEG